MVPDKFNMVDMGGIDLIESQGAAVEGIYQKLVESIALCRYQCLYNWKFNGILIPPSYVEMETREDGVWINEGVMVDEDNVIHIYSIEPEPPTPPEPEIQPLSVTENGEYYAPVGVDGYNPVLVSIPSEEPSLQSLTVTQNGIYLPDTGYDGFDSVSVEVPSTASGPKLYWDFSHSLIDQVEGLEATLSGGASSVSEGILLSSALSCINFPSAIKNYPFTAFEIELGETNAVLAGSHLRLFIFGGDSGLIYRNTGKWSFYAGTSWANDSDISDINFFSNAILRAEVSSDGKWKFYKNGSLIYSPNAAQYALNVISIGAAGQSYFPAVIKSFKVF